MTKNSISQIKLNCNGCGKSFYRNKHEHAKKIKRGNKNVYCSYRCYLNNTQVEGKVILCLNCKKETTNPKFCSRSCNAIYNNKKRGESSSKYRCKICGVKKNNNRQHCRKCYDNINKFKFYRRHLTLKISDVLRKAKTVKY